MTKSKSTLKAVIVPIVLAGFLLICSISVIPTGYTGVRITFGQIDKAAVKNGFNFKIPFVQYQERLFTTIQLLLHIK